jgi:hypothetical protein
MKTEDLIRALAADRTPPQLSVGASVAVGLAIAVPVSVALLMLSMGVRDIAQAVGQWRFDLKYGVALTLAVTSLWLALRLSRPGADTVTARRALIVAPLVLVAGVAWELASLPPGAWGRAAIGQYPQYCMVMVPSLSLPILVALLAALRRGAPDSPARSGVIAGLCAAGLGAAVYALHCTDDSPLFLALWYAMGVAVVALIGALAGRIVLRW